jgi:hypothetical protein
MSAKTKTVIPSPLLYIHSGNASSGFGIRKEKLAPDLDAN